MGLHIWANVVVRSDLILVLKGDFFLCTSAKYLCVTIFKDEPTIHTQKKEAEFNSLILIQELNLEATSLSTHFSSSYFQMKSRWHKET